ncbi:MAG: T9SS type A sorting domain-containing protein [Ignavibacteria bacterium]|nr:T9SS type A sorting domain-containing protein [Ignavibacteria bacterium]
MQTTSYGGVNVHQNAAPYFVDINNDTDADLFVGNIKGGLFFYRNDAVSSIQIVNTELPASFRLLQNYPNPFNPSTRIRFESNENSNIKLSVYDINGKETEVLYSGAVQIGTYEFNFNAADYPSGIYFCRLQSGDYIQNVKMLYLK